MLWRTGSDRAGRYGANGEGRRGHVGEQESQPMTELGLLCAGTTRGLEILSSQRGQCMAGSFSPNTFGFSA